MLVSALLFQNKFRENRERLDEVKSVLSGIRNSLTANNTIGCISYDGRAETASEVANALTPVTVIPYKMMDTNLLVFDRGVSDSMLTNTLRNKVRIWEARSEHLYLLLVINNR